MRKLVISIVIFLYGLDLISQDCISVLPTNNYNTINLSFEMPHYSIVDTIVPDNIGRMRNFIYIDVMDDNVGSNELFVYNSKGILKYYDVDVCGKENIFINGTDGLYFIVLKTNIEMKTFKIIKQ